MEALSREFRVDLPRELSRTKSREP